MLLLLLLLLWAGRGVGACGDGCLTCTSSKCTSCTTGYALDYYTAGKGDKDCWWCGNWCLQCTMVYMMDSEGLNFQKRSPCASCSNGYFRGSVDPSDCVACGTQCNSCALQGGVCNSCNSGYFINPANPTVNCQSCRVCTSRQKESSACGTFSDRGCSDCPSNTRVTTYECIACVDRVTYASADQSRCDGCTTCTTAQYLPSGNECTASRDTICMNCADNRMSKTTNSLTCNTCVSGYYLSGTTGACTDCGTPNCPANTYIQCASGTRTCVVCTGNTQANACPFGKEPNLICTGTQRVDSSCNACGPGSERPAASVSTTLQCMKCGLGYYKDTTSTNNCGLCTNKPAGNSLYLAWGNQIPSSNSCPW